MTTITKYREKLREDHGIETRPLWATGKLENDRFSLHCFQAYGPDGEWLGPLILQELNGGHDGILTYIGAPGNSVGADARAILANGKISA